MWSVLWHMHLTRILIPISEHLQNGYYMKYIQPQMSPDEINNCVTYVAFETITELCELGTNDTLCNFCQQKEYSLKGSMMEKQYCNTEFTIDGTPNVKLARAFRECIPLPRHKIISKLEYLNYFFCIQMVIQISLKIYCSNKGLAWVLYRRINHKLLGGIIMAVCLWFIRQYSTLTKFFITIIKTGMILT